MLLIFIVVGILIGYLSGGKIRNIEYYKLQWIWMPFVGVLLKFAGEKLQMNSALIPLALMYCLLLAFLVKNRKSGKWVWFTLVGTCMNALVIAANGWRMPVLASLPFSENTRMALQNGEIFGYALSHSATKFLLLGDVFRWPPIGAMWGAASIGDVIMGIGIAWLTVKMMRATEQ